VGSHEKRVSRWTTKGTRPAVTSRGHPFRSCLTPAAKWGKPVNVKSQRSCRRQAGSWAMMLWCRGPKCARAPPRGCASHEALVFCVWRDYTIDGSKWQDVMKKAGSGVPFASSCGGMAELEGVLDACLAGHRPGVIAKPAGGLSNGRRPVRMPPRRCGRSVAGQGPAAPPAGGVRAGPGPGPARAGGGSCHQPPAIPRGCAGQRALDTNPLESA
jgi:hypothetical protein